MTDVRVTRPDLVEENVSASSTQVNRGGSFAVFDTTRNTGAVSAPASTTRYYLSLDQTKSTDDTRLLGNTSRPALAAGAALSGNRSVTVPFSTLGGRAYFIIACADDLGAVTETSETNNCTASATRITVVQ